MNRGPRGLSSAHAQKFTAKPTVARASISHAWRATGAPDGELSLSDLNGWTMLSVPFVCMVVQSHRIACARLAPCPPGGVP
ncbi:hypothetical protein SSP531S_42560 [Streptomyces spongiicola]|uniref:Uncharacterized protein n=1 Tax=Streptomyces spongiicola TaxID=1690221 RepID=A0A388T3M8_9ACTN|nr:hypothetical protein SSP531S_42560 [Streptomyces spongiicola]